MPDPAKSEPSLLRRLTGSRLGQLIRFYQAAAINTLFGYGVFALLIWLGLNLYVAQIVAQVLGVSFNYFTYSRHVFRDRTASKGSFVLAYAGNYLVNLALLAAFSQVIASPYVAGFAATIAASVINYLALRSLVFRRKTAPR